MTNIQNSIKKIRLWFFQLRILPKLFINLIIIVPTIFLISNIISCLRIVFLLNESQLSFVFTSTIQIIGSMLAITITGYIFVIDRLCQSYADEEGSYELSLNDMKSDFFVDILVLGIISFLTILSNLFVVLCWGNDICTDFQYLINLSMVAFIVNIMLIIRFYFSIAYPKRLERYLKLNFIIKRNATVIVGTAKVTGEGKFEVPTANIDRTKEFLRIYYDIYNTLVYIVYEMKGMKIIGNRIGDIKKWRMRDLLQSFREDERLDKELYQWIRNILELRNLVIHDREAKLTADNVKFAKKTYDKIIEIFEIDKKKVEEFISKNN